MAERQLKMENWGYSGDRFPRISPGQIGNGEGQPLRIRHLFQFGPTPFKS